MGNEKKRRKKNYNTYFKISVSVTPEINRKFLVKTAFFVFGGLFKKVANYCRDAASCYVLCAFVQFQPSQNYLQLID